MTQRRQIWRAVVGAAIGLVIGVIVSVNVVIFGGIDAGYEATPDEVFEENVLIGLVALVALIAGPIAGAVLAWRGRAPG